MNCPICKTQCLSANDGEVWYCRKCHTLVDPLKRSERPSASRDPKLQTLQDCVSEGDVVEQIVDGLTALRYKVLKVGQWRADFSGTTPGTPDLLVTKPGCHVLVGLEVKTPKAIRTKNKGCSEEQWILHIAGHTAVVSSFYEALKAVESALGTG